MGAILACISSGVFMGTILGWMSDGMPGAVAGGVIGAGVSMLAGTTLVMARDHGQRMEHRDRLLALLRERGVTIAEASAALRLSEHIVTDMLYDICMTVPLVVCDMEIDTGLLRYRILDSEVPHA